MGDITIAYDPKHPFPTFGGTAGEAPRPRPGSGLSFPFTLLTGNVEGKSHASMGPDGVASSVVMGILWSDLQTAIKEILGYSWRDTSTCPPTLRRNLPWQEPYYKQTYAKSIHEIKGIRAEGNSAINLEDVIVLTGSGVGLGAGAGLNFGPWAEFRFAMLTIQFWRPPYFLRTDEDIVHTFSWTAKSGPQTRTTQCEWLRYFDKHWVINTQMLSKENTSMVWAGDANIHANPVPTYFRGAVGQKVTKIKLKRTWHQIPERAIFDVLVDNTPNGLPNNLLYMRTSTVNPVTGYVNFGSTSSSSDTTLTCDQDLATGQPITGCCNAPIGGGNYHNGAPFVTDNDLSLRFLGCPMGTLLYESVEINPAPLQMPAYLMQIPVFDGNEPIAQQQYDVTFHFEFFDPPVATDANGNRAHPYRGFNLFAYPGDGFWYPAVGPVATLQGKTTAIQYADLSDLFQIL